MAYHGASAAASHGASAADGADAHLPVGLTRISTVARLVRSGGGASSSSFQLRLPAPRPCLAALHRGPALVGLPRGPCPACPSCVGPASRPCLSVVVRRLASGPGLAGRDGPRRRARPRYPRTIRVEGKTSSGISRDDVVLLRRPAVATDFCFLSFFFSHRSGCGRPRVVGRRESAGGQCRSPPRQLMPATAVGHGGTHFSGDGMRRLAAGEQLLQRRSGARQPAFGACRGA